MSLTTAKPRPYALIPRPYAPRWTPSCGRTGQHPAVLRLAVVEVGRHAVHRQRQRGPARRRPGRRRAPRRRGLLVQPVLAQRPLHVRRARCTTAGPNRPARRRRRPRWPPARRCRPRCAAPGRLATVTTTAKRWLVRVGLARRARAPRRARSNRARQCRPPPRPTCISQRGPVNASSRPYHGKGGHQVAVDRPPRAGHPLSAGARPDACGLADSSSPCARTPPRCPVRAARPLGRRPRTQGG